MNFFPFLLRSALLLITSTLLTSTASSADPLCASDKCQTRSHSPRRHTGKQTQTKATSELIPAGAKWKRFEQVAANTSWSFDDHATCVSMSTSGSSSHGGIEHDTSCHIRVEAGRTYLCSFDFRTDNLNTPYEVDLLTQPAPNATSGKTEAVVGPVGEIIGTSLEWRHLTVALRSNVTDAKARLRICGRVSGEGGDGTNTTFWIRNISLREQAVKTLGKRKRRTAVRRRVTR